MVNARLTLLNDRIMEYLLCETIKKMNKARNRKSLRVGKI